jgi:hypothetical protein
VRSRTWHLVEFTVLVARDAFGKEFLGTGEYVMIKVHKILPVLVVVEPQYSIISAWPESMTGGI